MNQHFTLLVHKNLTACLVFDSPEADVNKLSSQALLELEKILQDLKKQQSLRYLVIESRKPKIFIAGADIKEIESITTQEDAAQKAKKGQEILTLLTELPFPKVAIINGACLGGGLELALSCTYIVATDSPWTKLGLPEVRLGIIPGFGGTQRLPKRVGFLHALNLITSGSSLDAKKALKVGLIDKLIPEALLENFLSNLEKNSQSLEEIFHLPSKRVKPKSSFLTENFMGRWFIAHWARRKTRQKTNGHYPAPIRAIDVLQRTFNSSLEEGLATERHIFSELCISSTSKNLIYVFYAQDSVKKRAKEWGRQTKGITEKEISVIGGGVMGAELAFLFSLKGFYTRLSDLSKEALSRSYINIVALSKKLARRKKLSLLQSQKSLLRLSFDSELKGHCHKNLILEAIIEDKSSKVDLFKRLETEVSKDTILASNTSSLSISKLGETLKHKERFIGMHFFNPPMRMPLVEVIPSSHTSSESISKTFSLAITLGKTPILVKDCAGFLINRLLLPYMNEAAHMLAEGVSIKKIDAALEAFGMPMGPFALADTVGIDVGEKVSKILEQAYGPRMAPSPCLQDFISKGNLGRKSGKGFYLYKGGKKKSVSPLAKNFEKRSPSINNDIIIDRCLLIMVNEAYRCLQEKVVATPHELDCAMILGAGFPPFRGGLLHYATQRGLTEITGKLEALASLYGQRFQPCGPLLGKNKEGLDANI